MMAEIIMPDFAAAVIADYKQQADRWQQVASQGIAIERDLRIEIERLRAALEMIAGVRPCPDNLLGNADIARIALKHEMPVT